MSVSEPNLTASEASAVSLLETFAAVARRRTSATSTVSSTNTKNQSTSNTTSTGLFGTKSVSSLVRLAISSNFPASLLNSAQSYPSLGASATSAASPGGGGGQNHDTEQVSLEEFLESCRATSLLAELEDDEELPEAEDEDNDDEANDDEEDYDENFDEESATSEPRNTASTLTSR